MALSPKQQRFVAEYLVDLNATKAAERAGYSAKTARAQGSRLLTNADIQSALKEALEKQQNRLSLSADRVLLEFMRVAYSDPLRDVFDKDGRMLGLHDIPEDARRAVASVEVEERFEGRGEDAERYTVRKVKFWNKNEALSALGKHLKLFTDVLETKVKGMPREQRAERVAQLLAEALERRRRDGVSGP